MEGEAKEDLCVYLLLDSYIVVLRQMLMCWPRGEFVMWDKKTLRPQEHISETASVDRKNYSNYDRIHKMKNIWQSGREVLEVLLSTELVRKTSSCWEATIIDAFPQKHLTKIRAWTYEEGWNEDYSLV